MEEGNVDETSNFCDNLYKGEHSCDNLMKGGGSWVKLKVKGQFVTVPNLIYTIIGYGFCKR